MHDILIFFPALHKTNDFKKFLCNLDLTALRNIGQKFKVY